LLTEAIGVKDLLPDFLANVKKYPNIIRIASKNEITLFFLSLPPCSQYCYYYCETRRGKKEKRNIVMANAEKSKRTESRGVFPIFRKTILGSQN